ncbi:hypothetical protein WOLCODRAFT_136615 [Wolfiporia cocos MD-104 SS10]|uniref:Chromatin modification-related protein EAF7 n=1 Tax=Wolfiporia cocos (strain MD-104) TaxID=742152 RepID=A0A2H3JEQ5_WOLCO|nr:hypothetical protein WOLCODRAFT_136615 [Wolfiporia cocos MD-104 SS10]
MNDENDETINWLDTVEGEIAFFRSMMRARPVGLHRHFHVLTIRNAILRDSGRVVTIDDLWTKLRSCYDLDILENIELDGYDPPGYYAESSPSSSLPPRSPSPSENLSLHPFFRHEFALPAEESFDSLIATRRMRASASLPPSSPAGSPATRPTKKGRSKLKNAGLVAGDSDSSALTQESGDESTMPTPKESYATGTDGGTDYADDEDADGGEPSPASKQVKRGTKSTRRGSAGSRGRGASTAGGRGTKRKKKT